MDKILNFIKTHKGLSILLGLGFVLFLIIFVTMLTLLIGNNKGTYGDRLEGIEKVKLSTNDLNDMSKKVEENDAVEEADFRVQGKIVYVTIKFKEGTNLDSAKEIANNAMKEFSEDEIAFYDLEFFLKENKDKGFVVVGNKHPSVETIGWTNS